MTSRKSSPSRNMKRKRGDSIPDGDPNTATEVLVRQPRECGRPAKRLKLELDAESIGIAAADRESDPFQSPSSNRLLGAILNENHPMLNRIRRTIQDIVAGTTMIRSLVTYIRGSKMIRGLMIGTPSLTVIGGLMTGIRTPTMIRSFVTGIIGAESPKRIPKSPKSPQH